MRKKSKANTERFFSSNFKLSSSKTGPMAKFFQYMFNLSVRCLKKVTELENQGLVLFSAPDFRQWPGKCFSLVFRQFNFFPEHGLFLFHQNLNRLFSKSETILWWKTVRFCNPIPKNILCVISCIVFLTLFTFEFTYLMFSSKVWISIFLVLRHFSIKYLWKFPRTRDSRWAENARTFHWTFSMTSVDV